jgi:hypothetical protein
VVTVVVAGEVVAEPDVPVEAVVPAVPVDAVVPDAAVVVGAAGVVDAVVPELLFESDPHAATSIVAATAMTPRRARDEPDLRCSIPQDLLECRRRRRIHVSGGKSPRRLCW